METIYLIVSVDSKDTTKVQTQYGFYLYAGAAQTKAKELNDVAGFPTHQTDFGYLTLPVERRCKG